MDATGSTLSRKLDDIVIQLEEGGGNSLLQVPRTLVGKILTDKSLNRGAVKHILSKAWGDPEGLQMADVGMNLFMFIFLDIEEAQGVIRKGPWYVMNKLISLQQWTSQAVMKEIDFSKVQFWVQIHGLPLEYITTKNAKKILNQIGELVEIENMFLEGQLVRQFIRARIHINVLQPFFTGCWVPRRNLSNVWVTVKYEKLQDLCFSCGIIGHDQRSCKEEKQMSSLRRGMPKYGANLSVPPAKELSLIMEERKRWKQKARDSSKSHNSGYREASQADSSIQQGALIVRNQEEGEGGGRDRQWERRDGGGDDESQADNTSSINKNKEEQEGELPTGWRAGTPKGSPAPSSTNWRDMGRAPVNNLPFTNLRLQKGIPGFPGMPAFRLDDKGERRRGEFPWRPRALEVEDDEQEDQRDSVNVTTKENLGIADIGLARSVRKTGEGERGESGMRGQRKIEEQSRGR